MLTATKTYKKAITSKAVANNISRKAIGINGLKRSGIQAKLTIGQPNDKYEQEADRVADRVMTMPEPAGVQRSCTGCATDELQTKPLFRTITPFLQKVEEPSYVLRSTEPIGEVDKASEDEEEEPVQTKIAQRQAEEEDEEPVQTMMIQKQAEEEEEEPVQTKPEIQNQDEDEESSFVEATEDEEEEEPVQAKTNINSFQTATPSIENNINRSKGQGTPLPDTTRSFMENRFGTDFSYVRVHNDNDAIQLNQQLNSQAFTNGSDIYFNSGKYNPVSSSGKHLLAHELTHVIQQGGNSSHGSNVYMNKHIKHNYIQRYILKGFSHARARQMLTAINEAIRDVKSCKRLSWIIRWMVSTALRSSAYEYDRDLGDCGFTWPLSPLIKIGEEAFDRDRCCDLKSTLAHEAAHTVLHTEKWARYLECLCFGCSC